MPGIKPYILKTYSHPTIPCVFGSSDSSCSASSTSSLTSLPSDSVHYKMYIFISLCFCLQYSPYSRKTRRVIKVSTGMLIHKYPHKPLRKIKVTICNHQDDSQCYLWPYVHFGDLHEKSMVIHDTECSYWDQVSLNNTNSTISDRWKCYM